MTASAAGFSDDTDVFELSTEPSMPIGDNNDVLATHGNGTEQSLTGRADLDVGLAYAPPKPVRRSAWWSVLETAAAFIGAIGGFATAMFVRWWFDNNTPINSTAVWLVALPACTFGGAVGGTKLIAALRRRARLCPGVIRPLPPLAQLAIRSNRLGEPSGD